MSKCVVYVLVILSLHLSQVIAGYTALEFSTHAYSVAIADGDKANEGHDQLAGDHHCCAVHAHDGNLAAYESPVPPLLMTRLRLPVLADPLLAAFGPSPPLKPPSRA